MHSPVRQPRYRPRPPQRPGSLSGRSGVSIVLGAAAFGLVVTVLAGSEPGDLLGLFLIAGTLIAALAVRADAVHVLIPAPALAYLAAGTIAGFIHDRAADTSRTALAVSALQWMAAGFLSVTAATVLAVALTIARRIGARAAAPARRHGRRPDDRAVTGRVPPRA